MKIDYDAENPLHGILYFFYAKNNKYTDYVHASVTSSNSEDNTPYSTIDFDNSTYWLAGGNNAEEYLTLLFPKNPIKITGYSLQTSGNEADKGYHPKKWKFGVSVDSYQYENIDEYNDDEGKIKGSYKTIYIPYLYPQYANCFRLYPLENTNCDFRGMDVNQIEIFGEVYISTFQCTYSCMLHPFFVQSLTYIMILF